MSALLKRLVISGTFAFCGGVAGGILGNMWLGRNAAAPPSPAGAITLLPSPRPEIVVDSRIVWAEIPDGRIKVGTGEYPPTKCNLGDYWVELDASLAAPPRHYVCVGQYPYPQGDK